MSESPAHDWLMHGIERGTGVLNATELARPLRVLMVWPLFPPSLRSGGPARSAEGLLVNLAEEFEFFVVTSAFDGPHKTPMHGVQSGQWIDVLGAKAWYVPHRRPRLRGLLRLIRECDPDVVYFNSLWDRRFTMRPLLALLALRRRVPILIAPRGELSEGALRIHPWRKRFVASTYRLIGISRKVAWHASTELERADIQGAFGTYARCYIAGNLRVGLGPPPAACQDGTSTAATGALRLVFLSRITPKKNLDGLLKALAVVEAPVELTIAGPIDDLAYWRTCEQLVRALPPDKEVVVHGTVEPAHVVDFLASFDLFVLPTHGENFGHAILEALAAGLPVIVGNDTPWSRVEEVSAGWLVDSGSPVALAGLIDRYSAFGATERSKMGAAARGIVDEIGDQSRDRELHRSMFHAVGNRGLLERRGSA